MCGLAGVVGLGVDLREEDRANVRGMTRVLHHRGPDHTGFLDEPRCVLGNARLNVIDLSHNGDLPMSSADGRVWIAYNGEVTNFRELRAQFRLDERHRFRSTSDTEVLVHLYEELGIDFCRHLSGMFAFTLYDRQEQKAWVVRDFFGIRPLFWMRGRDRLYFASEIKSFLDLPEFSDEVDVEALYHFFSLAYLPDEHTPFSCVKELQGGRLIEVDLRAGRVEERSYYEVHYDPDPTITERDIVEPLYREMSDSVRRNLIADAPLGLTYSGGFDTSSILALARELHGDGELHTFSIVMEEASFDESRWQYQMVDPTSPYHHEVRVGPKDVLEHLHAHMAFMDEPSGDGAAIPSFILAKEAKKYVTVLLSGEGGDETFNAYETHVACKARQLYRKLVPRLARTAVRKAVHALPCDYRKLSFDFVAKRFTEGAEMGVPEAHLHWRYVLRDADKRALLPSANGARPTEQLFRDVYDSVDFADPLNRISLIDLKYYFIGDLMVKNDRTMMAHSIEARFPYMDRLLLEFVAKIPVELRIKNFTRRYIQKKAMEGRVPDGIFKRQNMGLEMPHSLWFLKELRPLADRYFARDTVARTGFLDPGTVSRLWDEHQRRKHDHGRALWCILNVLVWHELFVQERTWKRYLPQP